MSTDEQYMLRCIALAKLGEGAVSPNPMVGSILVHSNTIIGEGYHQQYGTAHAEVNCLSSVQATNRYLIAASTLYISLEPCNHTGNTPPCTNAILASGIKRVVVGCVDSNALVNGSGITKLKEAGIEVAVGVLEKECLLLNESFFYHQKNKIPHITLKWAQSSDGFINVLGTNRTYITNNITNRYVHSIRATMDAIIIGSTTLQIDNPALTNRFFGNKQPVKIIVDRKLQYFNKNYAVAKSGQCIILNTVKDEEEDNVLFLRCATSNFLQDALQQLYKIGIGNLLVEGGAALHQQFIAQNLYQKIIVITNNDLLLKEGIAAPKKWVGNAVHSFAIQNNTIKHYTN